MAPPTVLKTPRKVHRSAIIIYINLHIQTTYLTRFLPPSPSPRSVGLGYQGRPQDLGGGGKNFARGVRGHAPQENFYKWCNLVRFGAYLNQIFYLKKFQKVPFFI